MRRSYSGYLWSALAAAALLACGGAQPAPAAPGEPGAEPAADGAAAGGGDVWSDTMSDKEKGAFMKKKVMPAMSKIFKDHDAKEFGDFGCKTCHGPQFKPHPVDFLPTLHFKDGKMLEAEKEPEMVKFMHDSVTPAMAELFGKKPYDPATNEGFGCKGCHNVEM